MGEQQKNSYTTKADRLKEEYAAKMKVYKLYTANVAAFTAEVAEERAKDAAVAAGQAAFRRGRFFPCLRLSPPVRRVLHAR